MSRIFVTIVVAVMVVCGPVAIGIAKLAQTTPKSMNCLSLNRLAPVNGSKLIPFGEQKVLPNPRQLPPCGYEKSFAANGQTVPKPSSFAVKCEGTLKPINVVMTRFGNEFVRCTSNAKLLAEYLHNFARILSGRVNPNQVGTLTLDEWALKPYK